MGLLDQQNPTMLSKFAETIGTGNQPALLETGSKALQGLFGQATTQAVSGALGKFVGIPAAASTGVLGLLAPVALGTLAKERTAKGLDASGLAAMLAGQRDNISMAMPAGFADVLKGTGLFDGATAPVREPAAKPSGAAMATPAAAKTARSFPSWLLLLPALALGLVAWQYLSTRGPVTAPSLTGTSVDIGKRTAGLYEGIKTSVAGIKDEASATASLPKLREQSAALLDIRDMAEKLPTNGRKDLAALVSPWIPGLQALITSAIKAPGAETTVKPVLEQIIERLQSLAKG